MQVTIIRRKNRNHFALYPCQENPTDVSLCLIREITSQSLGVDAQGLRSWVIDHLGLGKGSASHEGQGSFKEVTSTEDSWWGQKQRLLLAGRPTVSATNVMWLKGNEKHHKSSVIKKKRAKDNRKATWGVLGRLLLCHTCLSKAVFSPCLPPLCLDAQTAGLLRLQAEEALHRFVRSEEGLTLAFQWTPLRTELWWDPLCYLFYRRAEVIVPLCLGPLSTSVLLLSASLHVTFVFPFWVFAGVIAFIWSSSPPTSGFLFPSFKPQLKGPLLWEAALIKTLASCIYSIELLVAFNHNCLLPCQSSPLGSIYLKSQGHVMHMPVPGTQ